MTDAAKYVTDEATADARAALNAFDADPGESSSGNTTAWLAAALEAAAPHIIAAAEPDIRADERARIADRLDALRHYDEMDDVIHELREDLS